MIIVKIIEREGEAKEIHDKNSEMYLDEIWKNIKDMMKSMGTTVREKVKELVE